MAALALFLVRGKFKNPLNLKELPKRLGVDIQSDATGFTMEHALGSHGRYKIHASKAVQFKQGKAELHDVKIELFSEDGSSVDRIEGAEFEYDQKDGKAIAAGPVEITLMRPGVAPAIAPKAAAGKPGDGKGLDEKAKDTPLASVAEAAARSEIHVKTSGLTFDEKTATATTSEHVTFSMAQGSGSSMGATYDSKAGHLLLDRSVELTTERGGESVTVRAEHAEFERGDMTCQLHAATADYRGGEATAGDAKILFRPDGSAVRLDALNGFTLTTETESHIAAPTGDLEFNEQNQPQHGHLEGGVKMDSIRAAVNGNGEREMHGTAPAMQLVFTPQGELRHVHLERDVVMTSEESSQTAAASGKGTEALRVTRIWKSPLADIEFRDNGHQQAEIAAIHGLQGVEVRGESRRGSAPSVPSRLSADQVTGSFGPNSVLTAITGLGHASVEETAASGAKQTSTGDVLEAKFANPSENLPKNGQGGASQVQSAVLEGHVVMVQIPASKPGVQAAAPMRAWAGRAVYDAAGEWLHLTESPRIDDGGLQVTADKVDVSRESGDAFAHGNVKATWQGSGQPGSAGPGAKTQAGQSNVGLGGQGPAHVIAAEGQMHQATSEATFKGHARLWQQANSVNAPVILLNREKQTLVATSTDAAEPVRTVLLSASAPGTGKDANGKPATPAVIRVSSGDLKYSDAERKAVMHGGVLGSVTAETGTAKSTSNEVELLLLPAGNHAGKDGGESKVDRMTARGHVVVTSEGRHGNGEQLVYTGETGEYVLTGTSAVPPKMTDPARGNVTGEALIFNSRDDSVSIEGGGRKTTTETTAPK